MQPLSLTSHLYFNCDTRVSVFITVILGILFAAIVTHTMAETNNLKVLSGNAQFAKGVYNILAKEEGNVFFSPISAHTILSLAYQGSQGETSNRFASVLQVPEAKSCAEGYKSIMSELNNVENVTLYLANKVYVKDGYKLKDSFRDVATKSFSSEVQEINFGDTTNAAKAINNWVENKTHDRIKDLISPDQLDALTRLVLVNAIYFKGNWAKKFDASLTVKEPFYVSETEKIDVQMMHITKKFRYGQNDELEAQILQLPYQNDALSLVIILPTERNGMKKLESKLANVDLTTITDGLYETEVEVALPKFKIETKIDFKKVLKEMGLEIIFGSKADFSGLLESPEELYVSDVIQKAFIEVNEEGAEAAAATGMIMMMRCMPIVQDKEFFVADHPFLISLLHEKEGIKKILFFGKVIKPQV